MGTALLKHREYTWNLETYHRWQDREISKAPELGLVRKDSRIFAMGSCFADHVVKFLSKGIGVKASSFGESRFYDPVSVVQTLKHLFVEPQYSKEDLFVTETGQYAHPFRNPRFRANSYEELKAWSDQIESQAARRMKNADVIIITLGGTETWRHPVTKRTYTNIPLPDVFNTHMPGIAEFHNLGYSETYAALEEIYFLLRKHVPRAHVVFTVSPIRMTFTVTSKDVKQATCQAKSILRAAVGELTDKYQDHLHYFHSYEIVEYAPGEWEFFAPDNLHVTDLAVAVVMSEFAKHFFSKELQDNSGYELMRMMLRDKSSAARTQSVEKFNMPYMVVRVLRTLGLEKMALSFYRRIRQD